MIPQNDKSEIVVHVTRSVRSEIMIELLFPELNIVELSVLLLFMVSFNILLDFIFYMRLGANLFGARRQFHNHNTQPNQHDRPR
jgi:hypothetical protein